MRILIINQDNHNEVVAVNSIEMIQANNLSCVKISTNKYSIVIDEGSYELERMMDEIFVKGYLDLRFKTLNFVE